MLCSALYGRWHHALPAGRAGVSWPWPTPTTVLSQIRAEFVYCPKVDGGEKLPTALGHDLSIRQLLQWNVNVSEEGTILSRPVITPAGKPSGIRCTSKRNASNLVS